MVVEIHPDAIRNFVNGDHGAPFDLLGCHRVGEQEMSVRAFRPTAQSLHLITGKGKKNRHEMQRLHEEGFFELTLSVKNAENFAYQLEETSHDGQSFTFHDPYCFPPLLTEYDLYLLGEGRHLYSYEKMGAHVVEVNGVTGVNFVVWAPTAFRVSVIGSFNNWDGRTHVMRLHPGNGLWELFIPGLQQGDLYKYEIRSRNLGFHSEKTDPYGFFGELRPRTASVVWSMDHYAWNDDAWMSARAEQKVLEKPMSIYEVHLGSWRRKNGYEWLTYRELANDLVQYVKDMGYTHVELMPIMEHPLDASWGYQVTGYYAITSRFGTPDDFKYFVDTCHQNDIGVILDWVPAHFPKDGHGLSYFDGTYLYEHEDSRLREHPDWGTLIFNYGRNEVRNFLISNALFWLKEYHADGLRVDAVSSMIYLTFGREGKEWLPNKYGGVENLEALSFLRELNEVVHSEAPGTATIAEEATAFPLISRPTYLGGLGFTLKWNMGWMHDTLDYMKVDAVYRKHFHNKMTFSIMYAFNENFVLALSHDEVVHLKKSMLDKMSGDYWRKFASLRLLTGYQMMHPGKKLMFMGQEIGQWSEWSETRSLDWHLLQFDSHRTLQSWVRDLNHFYQQQPALWTYDFSERGFRWIEVNDYNHSVFSFARFGEDAERDIVIMAANFTPVPRFNYQLGVPQPGFYQEMLNSDSQHYGGSNLGNNGGVQSEAGSWQGYDHSIRVTVPPLAIVIFKLQATAAGALPATAS